jgi:hypothetical protein
MKKLTMRVTAALLVSAVLAFSSCSKEGPAGATGPAGPTGPTGATGAQGEAGAADVIYSEWTDTTTWQADTVHNGAEIDTVSYTALLSASQLDLNMLNTGIIKVYADFNLDATDPTVLALPYLGGSFYIDALFYLNTIQLTSNVDFTGLPVRYVLVPGGTAAGRKSAKGVIDWNNYSEVKKYLNLKD